MKYNIVGYGTLMDKKSAEATVGREIKDLTPVLVYGYRRIYNIEPKSYKPSQEMSRIPYNCGKWYENSAANIIEDEKSQFNGLMFRLSRDEYVRICRREGAYYPEVTKVTVLGTGGNEKKAIVFVGKHRRLSDRMNLLPKWNDIYLATRGAYSISRMFGKAFDATTFTVSGEKVSDFYDRYFDMKGLRCKNE